MVDLDPVYMSDSNIAFVGETRNSSGDEIANVNFLRRHLQPLFRSAPGRQYRILRNNAKRAITPFKVIQGHRFWYQSKAHIRLSIVISTNLYFCLAPFLRYSL